MEIKVGDLVFHPHIGYGTIIKVKDARCAIYWWTPADSRDNQGYLKPDYHAKYARQWKRNVEEMK